MSTFYSPKITRCLTGLVVGLISLLTYVSPSHGQPFDEVSAHISAETSVLMRIDPVALDTLIGAVEQGNEEIGRTVLQDRLEKTREILAGDSIWLMIGFPQMPLDVQVIVRDPEDTRIKKLKELWDYSEPSQPYGPFMRRLSKPDTQRPATAARLEQWKRVMASASDFLGGKGAIEFGCLPPPHLYETYQELQTQLPESLGGGPATLVADGLQTVAGAFDLKTGVLDSTIESASAEAAAAFADRAMQLLGTMAGQEHKTEDAKLMGSLQLYQHFAGSLFRSSENQVRWEIGPSKTWRLKKVLELIAGPMANQSAKKNLRELALAVLNYESAKQHLPPPKDSRGPENASSLSWRVHILPFMGKEELELFNKFAIDEPWDSPTNIKLLPEMPNIYSNYGSKLFAPVDAKRGYTTVVAPSSENTILCAPEKVTFGSIVDGSSNTILAVVVKDSLAVPWTAPQDYVFDRDKAGEGLKFTDGKTPVAMCDSSVRLLVPENDWVSLFEMNEGKPVNPK